MKKNSLQLWRCIKMDEHKQIFGKGFTIDELLSHTKKEEQQ